MIPIDTTTLVEPPKPRKWYQILYVPHSQLEISNSN